MRFNPSERNEITRALGLFYHIGITMTICIVGCLLAGRWLDEKFGSAPWFTLGLLLLGMAAAIFSMFKIIIKFMKQAGGQK